MLPPEVILDRFIRTQLRGIPGCSGYLGKVALEGIGSESFRAFLDLIQQKMNEAIQLEGVNASGGVQHPPFHFDYVNVSDGTKNAHAFQYEGYAFIVITLPMIEVIWHLSLDLSNSPLIVDLLHLNSEAFNREALQGLLFQIHLFFLVAHEYTHHIHQHTVARQIGFSGVWTEFTPDEVSLGSHFAGSRTGCGRLCRLHCLSVSPSWRTATSGISGLGQGGFTFPRRRRLSSHLFLADGFCGFLRHLARRE